MTSKCHWMPFYPCDYLVDTGHLSTLEHGAYLLLIMHYWMKGGLPDNEQQLARICRLPDYRWRKIRETIAGLFHHGWKHKRIDEEIAKADAMREKKSAAGKVSSAARRSNPLKNNNAQSTPVDTSTITPIREKDLSHRRAQAREGASRREREGFKYEKPKSGSSKLVELLNRPFAETFGHGRETDTDVAFPAVRAISYQGWGREIPLGGLPDSA